MVEPAPAVPAIVVENLPEIKKENIPSKMSLNDLGRSSVSYYNTNKPKSTGVNLGDLKSAISEAMKSNKGGNQSVKIDVPKMPDVNKKIETVADVKMPESKTASTLNTISKDFEKPVVPEVPEDVLRKILDTETKIEDK